VKRGGEVWKVHKRERIRKGGRVEERRVGGGRQESYSLGARETFKAGGEEKRREDNIISTHGRGVKRGCIVLWPVGKNKRGGKTRNLLGGGLIVANGGKKLQKMITKTKTVSPR